MIQLIQAVGGVPQAAAQVCKGIQQSSQFAEHLQQLIHRNGTEVIRAWFQPMDDQQLSYLLRFITYGLIGLIREWFQKNMDLPKEELLVTAEFLVDGATSRLLKDA